MRARRNRYRPDFRGATLDAVLPPNATGMSAGSTSTDPVVEHFRSRKTPRWFVAPVDVQSLARQIELKHPDWRDRILEQVSADASGLGIYSRRGPGLDERFPWGDIAPGPGDDPLYPVRPHRFAFLPRLALASHFEPAHLDRLDRVLRGWMQYAARRDNRYAYSSNLVVIQRLIACSWAWAFLAGHTAGEHADTASHNERLLLSILRADIAFLEPRLGYSVPNNHLLGDRFARWFIAAFWPELDPRDTSAAEQVQPWFDELDRQILPDGTSFEHSTHYHGLACEMATAFLLLQRRNGHESPQWLRMRLRSMLRFQLDLRGGDTPPIAIGDGIEDPMVPLNPDGADMGPSWTAVASALHGMTLADNPGIDAGAGWAWWMLGGKVPESRPSGKAEPARHYALGGFHILHGREAGTKLVFRTGPAPGTEVVAGHMHADLLSVYLFIRGTPCIVDAGTYSYRLGANPPSSSRLERPRHHLVGPQAHNIPIIAGTDPLGSMGRDFRPWATTMRAREIRVHRGEGLTWIEAELIGESPYSGQCRGVIHVHGEYWLIYDRRTTDGNKHDSGFQLAVGARVESCRHHVIRTRIGPTKMTLVASDGAGAAAVSEGTTSGGWVAPSYGELRPAPRIRFTGRQDVDAPTAFVVPEGANTDIFALEVKAVTDGFGYRVVRSVSVDYMLLPTGNGSVTVWGMQSSGRARWIRTQGSTVIESRVLDDA